MNWLNRLDDVLDKALTPQNSRHGNSSSASGGQHAVSMEHVAEYFGDESDSSQGSSGTSPPRSLEVAAPSIPGRVRRRSQGAAPAPGKRVKPAVSNSSRPAIPGKLKRNSAKQTSDKHTEYPGTIKPRMILKNRAEEERESSDSEIELSSKEVLPSAPLQTNDIEERHSEFQTKSHNESQNTETAESGESTKSNHDKKQNGPIETQQVTENEAIELIQPDSDSTQSSSMNLVKSVSSLAESKAWGILQREPVDNDKTRELDVQIDDQGSYFVDISRLPIEEQSSCAQIDAQVSYDAKKTEIVTMTTEYAKSDNVDTLQAQYGNRGENGGIAVALFSDDRFEPRLQPSLNDNISVTEDDGNHEANRSPSVALASSNCEQFPSLVDNVEREVEGSLLAPFCESVSKQCAQAENQKAATPPELESRHRSPSIVDKSTPPIRNSSHRDVPASLQSAVSAQSEPPALRLAAATEERLVAELGNRSGKEMVTDEHSKIHVSLSEKSNHGHLGNSILFSQPKEQDKYSKAPDFVADSFSIAKVPAAHKTNSERDADSPHKSGSLTKTDADVESTVSTWSNFKLDIPFDRSRNRHGTVKLRLLRARRLSCSIGSFVQGVISLKPWKGKVRTKNTRAYSGAKGRHGVCAMWDDCEDNQVSMIHAFSSDESPIPTIEIELTVSPLGMGMLGFSMGTLSLSCEELLMNPYRVHRHWLTVPVLESGASASAPMLQVEVMFEPTTIEEEVFEGDRDLPPDTIDIPEDILSIRRTSSKEENPSTPERLGSKEVSGTDELTCLTPFSDKSPPFSAKSQRSVHSQTRQHLLCLKKFRLPATCCVCSKSLMSGIRVQPAYRCEKCKIDCCEDCVLQIDIKLPCGSLFAQDAVKNSIQNKLSMDLILNAVAPVSGNSTPTRRENQLSSHGINHNVSRGIGIIDLVFLRTFVLDEPWSPESDAADILADEKTSFKAGSYYMRITRVGSKDTARTQTIQNSSKPVFDSEELELNVPHYGSEFRIDLVDALTDKAVGSSLLTTQSILQLQRDKVLGDNPFSIFSYFRLRGKLAEKIQLRIDLRHDMKDATTFDYFSPPTPSPHSSNVQRGDIVGYTDVLIAVKEAFSELYGDNPYECPPRPPDELNMRLFQLHLSRLSNLVETLKDVVNGYIYMISWKNPILTGLAFFISMQMCATFNPAFIGSLPCFFVIVSMITSALRRAFFQNQRDSFIQKEIEKRRKEENVVLEHAIHRPVGRIGIAMCGGRNISSLEFGFPGSVICRAFWNPDGLMSSTDKEVTESRSVLHEIGSTDRVYSANPVWKEAKESSLAKRLRSIQNFNKQSLEEPRSTDSPQFIFPVLQPFSTHDTDIPVLEPWESSTSTIDIEVGFTDVVSILPDSESTVGVVSIPFKELYNQKEIRGWFKIKQPGKDGALYNPVIDDDGTSQVLLKIWWTPPADDDDNDTDVDTRREESVFIQEEMMRSTIIQGESRRGVIGSSLGAINSVRGLTGHLSMVQNSLGRVLDTVEVICNALTFTDPLKSTILLGIIVCLWIFLSVVSVTVILYTMVLGQYGATFIGRFGSLFSRRETTHTKSPSPYVIWLMNAFRGIPTSEDLRRTYFWESLRRGVREAEQFSEEKRGKRLKMLFRARWYSSIQILSGDRWRACFAIIQGHRFTWWSSVNDFDEGCKPLGSIFLSGHSGVATPSPLDLKLVPSENLDRLVCLFGRGIDKQERLSLLTPSIAGKEELELAINHTISHKAD